MNVKTQLQCQVTSRAAESAVGSSILLGPSENTKLILKGWPTDAHVEADSCKPVAST